MTFRCRHCQHELIRPGGGLIIGETREAKLTRMCEQMTLHLQQFHPEHAQQFVMIGVQATTAALLGNFETADEWVRSYHLQIAAHLARATQRPASDERLLELVNKIPAGSPTDDGLVTRENVVVFAARLRDYFIYADILAAKEPA